MLMSPAADTVRVASEQKIFRLKCIASPSRSKTRDWLDIDLLLKTRAFEPLDISAATNGEAEQFIRSTLRKWAYEWTHQNSVERTDALASWQHQRQLASIA